MKEISNLMDHLLHINVPLLQTIIMEVFITFGSRVSWVEEWGHVPYLTTSRGRLHGGFWLINSLCVHFKFNSLECIVSFLTKVGRMAFVQEV